MDYKLGYEEFIRSIKQNKSVKHSMLLGAGASIESGVASANDCIWDWKKDIYLSHNITQTERYSNTKSETVRKIIQNWLDTAGGYPKFESDSEYSFYAEQAYPIRSDRRKYFQNLVTDKQPSIGYDMIALLAEKNMVKSVWTTNFDGLMIKAAYRREITPIEITLESQERIYRNDVDGELLCIALHGDYKYGDTKNTTTELDAQEAILIDSLKYEAINRNFIVIGYSGRDKSLMAALRDAFSNEAAQRLYWCGYGSEISPQVEGFLMELNKNGKEAFYVPTEGFDRTLLSIAMSCFEEEPELIMKLKENMSKIDAYKMKNKSFSVNNQKYNKVIKSNLIPVSLPKSILQFQLKLQDTRQKWDYCKTLRFDSIFVIPYKGKFYGFGNSEKLIEKCKNELVGEVICVEFEKWKYVEVSVFKELAVSCIASMLSQGDTLRTDGICRIWDTKKPLIEPSTVLLLKALKV